MSDGSEFADDSLSGLQIEVKYRLRDLGIQFPYHALRDRVQIGLIEAEVIDEPTGELRVGDAFRKVLVLYGNHEPELRAVLSDGDIEKVRDAFELEGEPGWFVGYCLGDDSQTLKGRVTST